MTPTDRLLLAYHRPLRVGVAGLLLVAVALAAGAAGPAFARLGTGAGLGFVAVAMGGCALLVAFLFRVRWLLWLLALGLGGQVFAVIGTVAELVVGIDAGKARQIRALGLPPIAGLLINLAYSLASVALFGWLAWRWWRIGGARDRSGLSPASGG